MKLQRMPLSGVRCALSLSVFFEAVDLSIRKQIEILSGKVTLTHIPKLSPINMHTTPSRTMLYALGGYFFGL